MFPHRKILLQKKNLFPVMYIACIHGYTLYKKIRENNDAFNFLLSTSNARDVFTRYFMNFLDENNSFTSILNASCKEGHTFKSHLQKISGTLFTVMCKNYVSEMNSKIHAGKKRTTTLNSKQCSNANKIRKLTSS